jgi:hypothetical protein
VSAASAPVAEPGGGGGVVVDAFGELVECGGEMIER